MNKKLKHAYSKFHEHFDYQAEFPNNIDFDQDAYADELMLCIKDNFDYIIEKYGTIPAKSEGLPEIIYD